MSTQAMPAIALAGSIVFAVLAFGLRTWVHYRRTGSTGFVGVSREGGTAAWLGGVLFAAALAAWVAAPILHLAGAVRPHQALADLVPLRLAGLVLYVLDVSGTLWAQFAMGESWRIGVDPTARTTLVAAGPFRWVRNPIFTAMTAVTIGLALWVPNVVSLLAVIVLVVALEIHVRLVEEPYLAATHGAQYRGYASRTGRFLPGIGRLASSAPDRGAA